MLHIPQRKVEAIGIYGVVLSHVDTGDLSKAFAAGTEMPFTAETTAPAQKVARRLWCGKSDTEREYRCPVRYFYPGQLCQI